MSEKLKLTGGKDGYLRSALIAIGVYLIVCLLRNRPFHEWESCIAFTVGVFFAENENRIRQFAHCKKLTLILIALLFMASIAMQYVLRYLLKTDYKSVRVVLGSGASITFILLMIYFLTKFKFENRFLRFTGTIFMEIYMFHQLVITSVLIIYGFDTKRAAFASIGILAGVLLWRFVRKIEIELPIVLKRKG